MLFGYSFLEIRLFNDMKIVSMFLFKARFVGSGTGAGKFILMKSFDSGYKGGFFFICIL
jgi:hypothetical protein